jgi:hypothetical protein
MIQEISFRFEDLNIDPRSIPPLLGYADGHLPDPFGEYLQQALHEVSKLGDIGGAWNLADGLVQDDKRYDITAGGHTFEVGKAVYHELKGSEQLAFYVCTAGRELSEKSVQLLSGDDPVLGYVYDVLGSVIVEAASDRLQAQLRQSPEVISPNMTNRYSPGYCEWPLSDQHKLFALFNGGACGVSLTTSALMVPVKSVSGVIGIGQNVHYREYVCALCSSKACLYRKVKPEPVGEV